MPNKEMRILQTESRISNGKISFEGGLPCIRELCWVSALLIVLLLLFFLTPILRHEVLSPADLLLRYEPWRQATSPDFEPTNQLLADYVFQFRPWRAITVTALKAGHIPLWNPYNYGGAPFLGNGQSAVFYPLNFLFLFLPEAPAVLLWAMIRLFIAGLSAYLFGRFIGLSVLGAGITGTGFAFSGFLVVWLFWPQVNVAIWLPTLFLAGEAIVRRPTLFRIVGLGAIVCIQFLGGHPETSLHILSAVTLYVSWRAGMLFRQERNWRRLVHRLATFAGAIVLGTGGAAVQILPLGEYILNSAALHDRLGYTPAFWHIPRPRFLAMIPLVCPYCFGSPLRGDLLLGGIFGIDNFNELNGGYVGLLSLVLTGIAIALGACRGLYLFFLILGGIAFCIVYRIFPVFNIINTLPLFQIAYNNRYLLILAFSLSVMAGRGVDVLMAADEPQTRRIAKRTLTILGTAMIGVAIVTVSLLIYVSSGRATVMEEAKTGILAQGGKEILQQSHEHYTALLHRYDRKVQLLIREGTGRVVLLALAGLAVYLTVKCRLGQRSMGWMLPAVLILDLFGFGRNYNPSIPAQLEYPSHSVIEFLRAHSGLFRVLTLDGGFPPNTNMIYGLSEVRGYDALETEAYHSFLAATGDYAQPIRGFRTLYFLNFESPLIDLLNVKYLISNRELRHTKLNLVWEGGVRVYENRSVMPKAFLVYRTHVFNNWRGMEFALRDPKFDPGAIVLLEEEGPTLSGMVDPSPRVRISGYEPERVAIEVSSKYDGILVLADFWFPGWKATVDGTPKKILRGNLLLRAVPIPAGNHHVLFQYDPLSFRIGVIVSEISLLIAVSLGLAQLFALRQQRRKL